MKHTTPLIQTFSQQNSQAIFSSPIQKHVLFFTDVTADYHVNTLGEYKNAAKQFQGK